MQAIKTSHFFRNGWLITLGGFAFLLGGRYWRHHTGGAVLFAFAHKPADEEEQWQSDDQHDREDKESDPNQYVDDALSRFNQRLHGVTGNALGFPAGNGDGGDGGFGLQADCDQ